MGEGNGRRGGRDGIKKDLQMFGTHWHQTFMPFTLMFFLYISAHFKIYLKCCHCILVLILEFDQGRPSDYLLNKFSVVGVLPRFHFHSYKLLFHFKRYNGN